MSGCAVSWAIQSTYCLLTFILLSVNAMIALAFSVVCSTLEHSPAVALVLVPSQPRPFS